MSRGGEGTEFLHLPGRSEVKVKVKQSRYRPGVAQRVFGSKCTQIS